MKKLKAIHVHTDLKFIKETKIFKGERFENEIIVIGKSLEKKNKSTEYRLYRYNYFNLKKVIRACNEADLVVLYDLDRIKSAIVNSLSEQVYVMWRFFGYELYGKEIEKYFSVLSRQYFESEKPEYEGLAGRLGSLISSIRPVNFKLDSSFEKAVQRIDLMLCICSQEYDDLLENRPNLPECEVIPLSNEWCSKSPVELRSIKRPRIILGNNRSPYNNHLDVIEKIKETEKFNEVEIFLPFNYGPDSVYAKEVRARLKTENNVFFMEEFLPVNEYREFVEKSEAMVINSYRQMAMDNIFMGIFNGLKIYLNKKNVIFRWLRSLGVHVYDVDELPSDIEKGNIVLDYKTIESNIGALKKYKTEYTADHFQELVSKKITQKKTV